MSRANQQHSPDRMIIGIVAAFGTLFGIAAAVWASAHLGILLGDQRAHIAGNPLEYVLRLLQGSSRWPGVMATISAVMLALVLIGTAIGVGMAVQRWRGRDHSIKHRAQYLATSQEVADLNPKQMAAKAARLRPGGAGDTTSEHGITLGTPVGSNKPVLMSFEDTCTLIAGPRRMKSTCYVIPTVVNAPGPVVATSNKRDVHDATRSVRDRNGRVWVFDPQGKVVGGDPEFWFNPLRDVDSIDKAAELVGHFAMGNRTAGAKTDAYFDAEGEQLLARLFLAASRNYGSLLDAYRWLQNPYDQTPIGILTASGDAATAEALHATTLLADKQRDGIYGTARSFVRCLENPTVSRWVVPPSKPIPEFDADTFVQSRDTVYSLSQEGEGNAGPLVAALTQAIFNAGRRRATQSPGGRLDPPLVSVLDEAANVVRLRNLPAQYSHFGSQGMPVMTVLQSWSQGEGVWGREGMNALWGASTVRLYGGGAAEPRFLEDLSQIVGEYDRSTTSYSYDRRSVFLPNKSISDRRERIYTSADLAKLPTGLALGLIAGHPPVLLQATPWMRGPHADDIKHSLSIWDPQPAGRS